VTDIIEKYLNIKLFERNISARLEFGGSVTDPAFELALAAAIISSYYDIPVSRNTTIAGRLSLSGAAMPPGDIEKRIVSCVSGGFKKLIMPETGPSSLPESNIGIDFAYITNISQLQSCLYDNTFKRSER